MNQESEKKRRRTHDEWVQYITNIVTVAGGLGAIATLFSGKLVLVIPAAAAAVFMVYSLKNRWVKSSVFGLLVVVLAVVASVIGSAQHGAPSAAPQRPSNVSGSSNPTTPSASSSPSSTTTAGSTTTASDTPKVILDTDSITLGRSQGVDVDQPNKTPVDAQGATGALDLYFDPGGLPGRVYAHDAESVFGASSSITDHLATCIDQFDPHSSDRNTQPYAAADVGSGFCFKTSDGHMAWMGVVAVDEPVASQSAQSVTLHVIVWDKAAP